MVVVVEEEEDVEEKVMGEYSKTWLVSGVRRIVRESESEFVKEEEVGEEQR